MKETICTAFGLVGSFLAALFGGWDSALATLLIFMGVDYVTGLMVAAAASGVKSGSFTAIGMKRTAASDDSVATLVTNGWTVSGLTKES